MAAKKNTTPRLENSTLDDLVEEAHLIDRETEEEFARRPRKFGVLPDEPELDLGVRLQEMRRKAFLTQGELADQTKRADLDGNGISSAVISLYERGVNRPGPREIRLLCEALHTSPNYLIYGDEDPFEQFGLHEYARYFSGAKSEAEFYAAVNYCFHQLGRHKFAILELMLGLLRTGNKDFFKDIDEKAVTAFLEQAAQLEQAKKQ
jgi:transcriptional regulator with XRE-family HTH domain